MDKKLHTVGNLLENGPTDKHFFVAREALIDPAAKNITLVFNSDDLLACLKEEVDADLPTVKQVVAEAKDKSSKYQQMFKEGKKFFAKNILVSGGAIVLFGPSVQNSSIVLLERDPGAPVDACRLTTAAGRMDELLTPHCTTEMWEEIVVWGKNGQKDAIFAINPFDKEVADDFLAKAREKIRTAAEKGKVPGFETRDVVFLDPLPLDVPGLWSVETFIDGELMESTGKTMFLCPDFANHTLEVRKVYLADLEIAKGGKVEGIADGDGFGRQVVVIPTTNLVDFYRKVKSATADQLRNVILNSQIEFLQTLATTEPARGGAFGKFFWNAKQPLRPLTVTISVFAEMLSNTLN